MDGLKGLKRQGTDKYAVEPLRSLPNLPATKLSAVIVEYARPLLDGYLPDDRDYEAAFEMASICWNLALLPQDQQEEEIHSIVRVMKEDVPGIETLIRTLVGRKKTLFAHDHRMVMNDTLVGDGKSRCLYVTSPLLPGSLQPDSR